MKKLFVLSLMLLVSNHNFANEKIIRYKVCNEVKNICKLYSPKDEKFIINIFKQALKIEKSKYSIQVVQVISY